MEERLEKAITNLKRSGGRGDVSAEQLYRSLEEDFEDVCRIARNGQSPGDEELVEAMLSLAAWEVTRRIGNERLSRVEFAGIKDPFED